VRLTAVRWVLVSSEGRFVTLFLTPYVRTKSCSFLEL
jgi:hypothetical protein